MPEEAQTGPARRGDKLILKKHLSMFTEYPEYRKIYDLLSKGIREK
jgi:hypothetical protein